MKKVLYFMGFLLAMASCGSRDEAAGAWEDPLGYDQEAAKTVAISFAQAPAIDFATIEDVENATVQLFIPTIVAEDEATATYAVTIYNADKSNKKELAAEDGGYVKATELSDAMTDLYGKNDDAHMAELDIVANVMIAGMGFTRTGSTTATVKLLPPAYPQYIYVPGNGQGGGATWDPSKAAALYSPNADGKYTGFAHLDGDFKFTKKRDWSAEFNYNDFTSYPSFMGKGSDTNINCSEAGLFYLEVDAVAGTIKATKITNMNLVGAFNGWNERDDTQQMTWNKDELCFVKTGAAVTEQWKFAANNSWDINLGGNATGADIDNLRQDGENITVVGTTIKLYPCRNTSDKIYCTVQ